MAEWSRYNAEELGFMELKTAFNRVYMSYIPLSRLLAGPGKLKLGVKERCRLNESGIVEREGSTHGGNYYYSLTEYGSWVLSLVRRWRWHG